MKKLILLICGLMATAICSAQGTVWEELDMKEALSKAERQGKKVFVDCYTKTCGPCKYMLKNIFTLKVCGDYFNKEYVCITRDMEEGEGIDIARNYKVYLCPTYLILNTDGSLFARLDGGAVSSPKEDFVGKVKDAVELGKMHQRYDRGDRDKAFLQEYRRILLAKDRMRLEKVVEETMQSYNVKELAEPENWEIFREGIHKTGSPLFQYVVKHRKALARIIGEEAIQDKIMDTYMYEFRMGSGKGVDYAAQYSQMAELAEDGYPNAQTLKYALLCRKIAQTKEGKDIDELLDLLPDLGKKVTTDKYRLLAVKEVARIRTLCTEVQKKEMIEVLNALLPIFDGRGAEIVQKLIQKYGV